LNRILFRGAVAVLALSLLAVACMLWFGAPPARAYTFYVGDPAPAFSGTTIDGQTVTLETYHGKPLVLLFWGSW
jgi:cytochrome oxidase Cu insertion factor (SCO1/SenC/PrrC family)